MKKYVLFFKLRFATGMQYRMAFVAALTTQLVWGVMECLVFQAVAEASGGSMPMNYDSIVTYIWLKESLFVLFNTWSADNDVFAMITSGDVVYELCRPVSIYSMWFCRTTGARMAEALMRCIPVLCGAFLMPGACRMKLPVSGVSFLLFLITLVLALGITVTFCMVVYMLCFFTISAQGWRMVLTGAVEFLSGNLIPLPFFPKKYLVLLENTPFAYMQNVPFRIYSGDLAGREAYLCMGKQIFWLAALMILGIVIWKQAEKRIVIQGG
ncbi:MAG: ABC-2 family transporter protein [Lachnospiraceae bacterium]|nr:ABC-2 family transporter protein [Lachnospiraceae bacterium]